MTKRWLLFAALATIPCGVVARILTTPAIANPPVATASPSPTTRTEIKNRRWKIAWTVPIPGVTDISLSTTGDNIAWTDRKGCARRLSGETGRMLWRTAPLLGINRVVAAPNGSVAAFSGLNPDRNSVVFLNALTGDRKTSVFAGTGAVWSAVFGSEDAAFVGTGGRNVYPVNDRSVAAFPTDGIPESLSLSSDARRIAFGTWAPAGVSSCSLIGKKPCWRRMETDLDRSCHVSLSDDGVRLLAVSTRGPHDTEGILRVHDAATGATLWEVYLPRHAAQPHALLSANGEYVAVTYRRDSTGADSDDYMLSYFDAEGNRVFADKGSVLFKPTITAIAADGSTLTVRSGDSLYTLDRRGNFISRVRIPSESVTGKPVVIERTESSADGKTILIQSRDEKLTLLHAER